MTATYYDNECSFDNPGHKHGSVQFSGSGRSRKVSTRDRLLSSVAYIRDVSNQSIRVLVDGDRNNSSFVAGYNVTNLIQGIGILGLPYAILKGGWIGTIMILLIAFIACSTGKMLVGCLYDYSQPNGSTRVHKTYASIGAAIWPKFGRSLLTALTFIEMFGGTTLYVILMSVESQKLISYLQPNFSIYYSSLILTALVLPLAFISKMSIVSWFSFIAVIGLLSTNVTITIYCFYNINNISILNFPALSISTVPLSLGIITFSYCAHAAFPGIESCMKTPSSFNTMLNISFILAATVKFTMPFLFVMIFGIKTFQQCSLNVEEMPFNVILEIAIILNSFFSIPLTMFIMTEQIDDTFQHLFHHSLWPGGRFYWFWLVMSRCLFLVASLFSAMMVPHFALLMGLVGSITGSCLTFIFPCLFSLILKKNELSLLQIIYRWVLIFLGIIFGIAGTIVSLMDIIATFR